MDEDESDEFDDVMRFEAEQQKSLEGQIVTRMIDSLQNLFTRNNSSSSPNDSSRPRREQDPVSNCRAD